MKELVIKILNKFKSFFLEELLLDNEYIKIQNGLILENLIKTKKIVCIEEAEFKVFSQFGEDGIIAYLIDKLEIKNKVFIEFGVEDYSESNTRFLMINKNWTGVIIDGNKKNIEYIKKTYYFWKYKLTAINKFITANNINDLLVSNLPNKNKHVGLLSIDIDGNDFWVLKAISDITADVLILEYNSLFGFKHTITVPYQDNFYRYDHSDTGSYFGASLLALIDLADQKGYKFVGTGSSGVNAFFVNKIHQNKVDVKINYNKAKFRFPTRSKQRSLLSREICLKDIENLKVLDLNSNEIVRIKELNLED